MRRKRTVGNRVWIGVLGFCLLLCVAMDGGVLYAMFVRWMPLRQTLTLLSVCSVLTWTTLQLLRRRLSISGADRFFS